MEAIYWFIISGVLLMGMAVLRRFIHRLPISSATIYLLIGIMLGSQGLGMLNLDPLDNPVLLEHITEIAVIISLFAVGLALRRSLDDRSWWVPVRLASVTMVLTIAAIAAVGVFFLNLPLGAAILLGAILAPTDPVLATDVQVRDIDDRDIVRSGLSGEGGLNDGTAFPFVMLGLGLLALHPKEGAGLAGLWDAGAFSIGAWVAWDLVWAVAVGLGVGAAIGWFIGGQMLRLRISQPEAFGMHAFLVLGVIALSYGLAELCYGYGFLSVFATGYALRYREFRASNFATKPPELPPAPLDQEPNEELRAVESSSAAHYLAVSLKAFTTQLEHILEAVVVVLIGSMLSRTYWTVDIWWFAPLLFAVLRPAAVMVGLWRSRTGLVQRGLMGWFGIRGIGSIYYLCYAIAYGFEGPLAEQITALTLSTIAVSIVIHGVTVTPLMLWYERRSRMAAQSSDEEVVL